MRSPDECSERGVGNEDLDSAVSRESLMRSPDERSEREIGGEDLDSAVSRESLMKPSKECSEGEIDDGDGSVVVGLTVSGRRRMP